jgi:hypothetical protein
MHVTQQNWHTPAGRVACELALFLYNLGHCGGHTLSFASLENIFTSVVARLRMYTCMNTPKKNDCITCTGRRMHAGQARPFTLFGSVRGVDFKCVCGLHCDRGKRIILPGLVERVRKCTCRERTSRMSSQRGRGECRTWCVRVRALLGQAQMTTTKLFCHWRRFAVMRRAAHALRGHCRCEWPV